ncbi:MAG: homoserine kinase [Erysipelothrix sp.]|nr:homoserine kinase [Erysipelothrix sp.]
MKFRITVPASTANIGSGFDMAGIALNLYNTFDFNFNTEGITFSDDTYSFTTSLVLDTFFTVLNTYNIEPPSNIHLHTKSHIPIARGLGSSSTCIVAGIIAANRYADLKLSKLDIAKIANDIEGHPDNVVSAVIGNMNLSLADKKLYNQNFKIHDDLTFIAIIPNYEVLTKDARDIMPDNYQISDVIHTSSRTAFLKVAFETGNKELIASVTKDKLHQPYRQKLIKNYDDIDHFLNKSKALTHWISGAGPTIIALVKKSDAHELYNEITLKFGKEHAILNLQICDKGAIIV